MLLLRRCSKCQMGISCMFLTLCRCKFLLDTAHNLNQEQRCRCLPGKLGNWGCLPCSIAHLGKVSTATYPNGLQIFRLGMDYMHLNRSSSHSLAGTRHTGSSPGRSICRLCKLDKPLPGDHCTCQKSKPGKKMLRYCSPSQACTLSTGSIQGHSKFQHRMHGKPGIREDSMSPPDKSNTDPRHCKCPTHKRYMQGRRLRSKFRGHKVCM